jgi:putative ABC transport system permease protein
MTSALARRTRRELTRHRVRTLLTTATLAAAVAGVWLFATPQQLDAAMNDRVADDRIHDVMVYVDGIRLDAESLAALRITPNVAGLDARAFHYAEMRSGDRVQDVLLVGVADFSDQNVNVVQIETGTVPRPSDEEFEALTDPQNARSGRFVGAIGEEITVRDASGRPRPVTITGEGSTVHYSNTVVDFDPVLYVPMETVWALAGFGPDVYMRIEFSVSDRADEATGAAIDAVREGLAEIDPTVVFRRLPDIRPAGEWPGEEDFDNFLVVFWVVGTISLLSAVLLIATTMNTLVREQTREIGIMKAIGASRRRVAVHFAASAGLLGVGGTIVGLVLGALLSNFLVGYSASQFIGVETGWQFSWVAIGLSVLVGVGATVVASLPAVLRGVRTSVHDAIGYRGIESRFGQDVLERSLRRARFVPRFALLGARGVVRRKGRSLATMVQVALAVGTMLGFASLLITMVEVSDRTRLAEGGDISVWSSGPGAVLDNSAIDTVSAVEGVARVQPIASAEVLVGETETFSWGLPADPVYPHDLQQGRWFTEAEVEQQELVAVVGPALANVRDVSVGESLRVETGQQSVFVEVIGIDSMMVGDGLALFVPIDTLMGLKNQSHPTSFWVETTSSDPDRIDRTEAEMRAVLSRGGYGFDDEVRHVEIAAERAQDRIVVSVIMSMGIPVVAIGMIGLVSTMTTNILERSREIGVLRSLGARAADVRRWFRSEALVLVVGGWVIGIGVGYLVGRVAVRFVNNAFDVDIGLRYPLWPLGVALVSTLAVAGLALTLPLRRAGRLPPSVALRYE